MGNGVRGMKNVFLTILLVVLVSHTTSATDTTPLDCWNSDGSINFAKWTEYNCGTGGYTTENGAVVWATDGNVLTKCTITHEAVTPLGIHYTMQADFFNAQTGVQTVNPMLSDNRCHLTVYKARTYGYGAAWWDNHHFSTMNGASQTFEDTVYDNEAFTYNNWGYTADFRTGAVATVYSVEANDGIGTGASKSIAGEMTFV